jgi:hypothetical protein
MTVGELGIEDHKDRFSDIVGDIAWRAARMPAEERAGYIWLTLKRVREMYAAVEGPLAPDEDTELAEHLQKWTEETVRMLAGTLREEIWQALSMRRRPDATGGG